MLENSTTHQDELFFDEDFIKQYSIFFVRYVLGEDELLIWEGFRLESARAPGAKFGVELVNKFKNGYHKPGTREGWQSRPE
jgi:hypothetical protein